MNLESQVRRAAQLAIAISTLSLIVSIAYEVGYFFQLDYRFISILSVSDFLRLGLLWMPLVAIIVLSIIYLFGNSADAILTITKNRIIVSLLSVAPRISSVVVVFLCILIALVMAIADDMSSFISALALLIASTINAVNIFYINRSQLVGVDKVIYFSPLVLAYSLMFGAWGADKDMNKESGPYVEIESESNTSSRPRWILLKTMENGVLVSRLGYREYAFYDWSRVGRIFSVVNGCESFRFVRRKSFFETYLSSGEPTATCELHRRFMTDPK
ncbi:hypothetical protein [Ancylobacter polymorphus]|uniref:Uncharacterized protein n=2 Tax=Ancylobacter polymorphus TaxID=223390 RepID=A0ABU0B6E2_9HYPH|nr:hypothetical protein [Ancylobacter polymorphus]